MEREVFTVAALNYRVRDLLEGNFPEVWVEGEISNLARPASGHMYFTIKDEQAQVRCAMFRSRNRQLGFTPDHGTQVVVRARVSLYPDRGDYQLIVDHMEETGDGALRRAFEILNKKLQKEGLYDPHHKQSLPEIPKCLGVITSATGAAIRDVLHVLSRRFPNLPVIIYPTLVQGDRAAAQIVKAIEIANQRQECDVLLVTRGGGALEDLWPFNEEIVARAVFASQIPVVSGVGHEIDFTICDFVADVRAPTPSAAAELISPDQRLWWRQFGDYHDLLIKIIYQQLQQSLQQTQWLRKRLRHPGQQLLDQAQRLDYVEQRLFTSINTLLQRKQQQLQNLTRALDAISPLATLQRGYAIVTENNGKIVTDTDHVNIGDTITARLGKGQLRCTVDGKFN